MDIFIITGASKGLGFSIVKNLSKCNDCKIICISRHKNEEIEKLSLGKNVEIKFFEFDLLNLENIEKLIKDIFAYVNIKNAKNIYLINNAGIIAPLKPITELTMKEILDNIYINFISSLELTSFFLKYTNNSKANKFIVNISSKSAENPIKHWLCYSSSKAALDNLTKYISVEYLKKSNIKSISFHPPAMDTSMRKENIKSKNIFERIWDFISIRILKKKKLYSPDEVAEKILKILLEKNFHSGSIIEIK